MCFKISWVSLIFGKKFTVFLCFTLYYRTITKYKLPWGAYIILVGRFNGRFFGLRVWWALEGFIHGGAYFRNFTVFIINIKIIVMYKNSEYSIPQTEHNPLQYRFGPSWHCDIEGSELE